MEEVRRLEKAGYNILMVALLSELEYDRDKLAELGIKADDIGIVARAIYGNFGSLPLDKMSTGLSELGYAWSHSILTGVELAIKKVIF